MKLTLLETWTLYRLIEKFSEDLVLNQQGYTDHYKSWYVLAPKVQYLAIGRIIKKLNFQSWMTDYERSCVDGFLNRLKENLYYDSITKFYHEDINNWVYYYDKAAHMAINRVLKKWRKKFLADVIRWQRQKERSE